MPCNMSLQLHCFQVMQQQCVWKCVQYMHVSAPHTLLKRTCCWWWRRRLLQLFSAMQQLHNPRSCVRLHRILR
jgi:hypothetical protein